MCNPVMIGMFAMTALSTGLSMYAQGQQQSAANAQAAHQAALDRARQDAEIENSKHSLENARIARKSAMATDSESEKAQMAYIRRLRAIKNKTEQDFAARGVFTGSDVVVEEVGLQQTLGRQDLRTIQTNFERKAMGFQQMSTDLIHQAGQQLKGAQQYGMNAAFNQSMSNNSNAMAIAASLTAGIGRGFGQVHDFKVEGFLGGYPA